MTMRLHWRGVATTPKGIPVKTSEVVQALDLGESVVEFDEALEKYFVEAPDHLGRIHLPRWRAFRRSETDFTNASVVLFMEEICA
jgi:hypothetical protein